MYDSIYMYIEKYNDKMIKNNLEIHKIIEVLKNKPTNNKIQEFCNLRDMQKSFLYELLKKIKSRGYHLSELLYRKNLNEFEIQSVKIKYDKKIYIFSKTCFYYLKSVINKVSNQQLIKYDIHIIKEYTNYQEKIHDENEEYRDIENQLRNKNIQIIGVLYNKIKNEYLPFEFNYV